MILLWEVAAVHLCRITHCVGRRAACDTPLLHHEFSVTPLFQEGVVAGRIHDLILMKRLYSAEPFYFLLNTAQSSVSESPDVSLIPELPLI